MQHRTHRRHTLLTRSVFGVLAAVSQATKNVRQMFAIIIIIIIIEKSFVVRSAQQKLFWGAKLSREHTLTLDPKMVFEQECFQGSLEVINTFTPAHRKWKLIPEKWGSIGKGPRSGLGTASRLVKKETVSRA